MQYVVDRHGRLFGVLSRDDSRMLKMGEGTADQKLAALARTKRELRLELDRRGLTCGVLYASPLHGGGILDKVNARQPEPTGDIRRIA